MGEARLEASNNAREYSADAARLQLASARALDVQPWLMDAPLTLTPEPPLGLCVEPDAFELQLRREHGVRLFENSFSPSNLLFNDCVRNGLGNVLARTDPKPYASATEKLDAQADKTKERMASYLARDTTSREHYRELKATFDGGRSKTMSVILAVRMFIDVKDSNEEDLKFNLWAELTAKHNNIRAMLERVRQEMGDAW